MTELKPQPPLIDYTNSYTTNQFRNVWKYKVFFSIVYHNMFPFWLKTIDSHSKSSKQSFHSIYVLVRQA